MYNVSEDAQNSDRSFLFEGVSGESFEPVISRQKHYASASSMFCFMYTRIATMFCIVYSVA